MNDPATKPRTGAAICIACAAAMLSTMLGIGGGVVMVPLLTLFARMPIKRTAGTSLAVIFLVIVVGVIAQEIRKPGDIHWNISLVLAAGAFGGTFVGRWLNGKLPENVFKYIFCALLIAVAIRLLGIVPRTAPFLGADASLANPAHLAYLAGAGLFAGIVAALFGLGGGVIVVPALVLAFGFYQQDFVATRATSLGMILPTSLISAYLHYRAGNIDMRLVTRMAPFAVVFSVVGVLLAYVVPGAGLKIIFGVLLIAASIRLALKNSMKSA